MKTAKANTASRSVTKISLMIFACLLISIALKAQNSPLQINSILSGSSIHLGWSTGERQNVSHFTIERSSDGTTFSEIALVFTGETGNTYTYADKITSDSNTVLYYRLKMVTLNGSIEFSKVS